METIYSQVGQVIIAANEDLGLVVLWNRSATLNLYSVEGGNMDALDCKSLGFGDPITGECTFDQAIKSANEWLVEIENEGQEED